MAWITTKDGKHVNTDWFDKDRQIESSKAEGDIKNLEEKYIHINPHYKKDASHLDAEGYNNNCVKCALAFEANMRGADVEARPFVFADGDELDKVRRIDKAFNDVDTWDVGRSKRELVVREIELTLTEDWGPGSRGIIQVQSGKTKHAMNIINLNGKVIIIDPQAGTQGSIEKMLKGLPTKSVHLFRTDNLSIKEEYKDWAYQKRKG